MKKNFFIKLFILLIIFVPFFFGFAEKKQLHEKLMIKGIGIDYKENKYFVTVQALDFKNPSGEKQPSIKVLKIDDDSVGQALDKIPELTGLKPLFSQNLIIIIGKNAADAGLSNFMDFFIRYYENRLNVKTRMAQNTAAEVFDVKFNDKPVTAEILKSLTNENSDVDVLELNRDLTDKLSDPVLPVISIDKENVVCEQVAIFRDDKLVCILDQNETMSFKILKSKSDVGVIKIENADAVCSIKKTETKISLHYSDQKPKFEINSEIYVDIIEKNKGNINKEELKIKIEEKLSSNIKNLLIKILNLECDPFKFGKILRNKHPIYFKEIEDNWKKMLPSLIFDLKLGINLKFIKFY
ncbi:MAG: Ger(x)C family spore germination protein [Candidatus Improbicoccus pseudotrichonymphae]|uniref:Ger(X)C family spore germination protein n=1 Tax=Candidatus Improbicoccus pseudotrichonymphae TaxID=3033792 RepID=A0AA48KWN7_9FIRM|nr:MAG: Ger(x)C family spore germination protein [Candidatus Improbicoccus pseudotrichonymphae]